MGFRTCSFLSPSSSHAIPLIPTSSRTSIPARFNPVASAMSLSVCLNRSYLSLFVNGSGSSSSVASQEAPSTVIFAKGLPLSMTEGRLKEAFSPSGEVHRVKIVLSKNTKQSHGFAYIWYRSEESAELAVKEMDGKLLLTDSPEKISTKVALLSGAYLQLQSLDHAKTPRKATPYKF